MAVIARLETLITATMDGFDAVQTQFQKIDRQMNSLEKSLGFATKALGAFGIGLGVREVVQFADAVGDFAGHMLDLSAETKISTDSLQAFNYMAGDVGLTIDDVVRNVDQLAKRIGSGDKSAVSALEELGIKVEDFKQLNLEEALYAIDQKMVGVANQFERTTLFTEMFGKSGAAMARMMNGSLEEVIAQLKKTGPNIDKELLDKADKFQEFWQHAWLYFQKYAVEAGEVVYQLWDTSIIPILWRGAQALRAAVGGGGGPSPIKPMASHATGVLAKLTDMTGIISGNGVPEVDTALEKARLATERLDREYVKLMGDVENDRGLMLMAQDAAFLNSSLSAATVKLRELAMNIGPLGVMQSGHLNPALLMGGPGSVTYGGNLYGRNSGGVPLIGQHANSFFGGIAGGFQNFLGGMTGGRGVGGFMSNLGGSLVGGIGNFLGGALTGGISSLIGFGVQGIGKLFGKMFGAEGKQTNDLRDQLFGQMGGFDAVAKSAAEAGFSMDRLLQPSKVKDMQRAWEDFNKALQKHQELANNIAQLTDAQAQRQQMLQDALGRYNFTAVEKGPLINMQEMAAQAEQLLTDYQLLSEAGVDHTAVLREMSSSVSDFVNRAIKTGTEVPEAMRGMIEEMIKNGELLDENGVAFSSLEQAGIHFGESLTEMFKGVLQKLDELIEKLNTAISSTQTLNNLPTPNVAGPDILNSDIVPMASGGAGMVTRPTLFLAGENGPEQYAFSGGGRSFGGGDSTVLRAILRKLDQQGRTLPLALRDAVLLSR